jgi:opacity protein-like surface antigen
MKKLFVSMIATFAVLTFNSYAAGIDSLLSTKDAYAIATIGVADKVYDNGLHYSVGVGAPLVQHPNIAIEVAAGMYGDQTLSGFDATYSVSHFGAAAVYNLPIEQVDHLTAFAKAGLNYVSATAKVGSFTSSSSGISLAYGIGAQYELNDKIDIRVQYENLGGEWVTYGSLNAGVLYHFQ